MNIFKLHEDHVECAKQHIDKHVVKMCTEYAQMLSTAHRVLDGKMWYGQTQTGRKIQRWYVEDGQLNHLLYKASHINHPCNKWLRASSAHYKWLYLLWDALCAEYTHRYGKVHKAQQKLEYILLMEPRNIPHEPAIDPPAAMGEYPHCIVEDNIVASYRNYYWEAKREFSSWTKRPKPDWWHVFEQREITGTMGELGHNGLILE